MLVYSAIGINMNKILGEENLNLVFAKLENCEKRKLRMRLEKKESFGFFKKKDEST